MTVIVKEEDCEEHCFVAYVIAAGVVLLCWLCSALWAFRMRKKKKNALGAESNREMTSVTTSDGAGIYQNARDATAARESIVYSDVVFKKGRRKPTSEPEVQQDVTYAYIKKDARQAQADPSSIYSQVVK